MIGLPEKPDALRTWLIAGPESAEKVHYFEQKVLSDDSKNITDEDKYNNTILIPLQIKKRFMAKVKSLESTINNLGNSVLKYSL